MNRKVRYAAVGGTSLVASYGCLYLFATVAQLPTWLAYLLQTIVAIEINFLLNNAFTWKDRGGSFRSRYLRFHAARVGVMIPLNQILFNLFHELIAHAEPGRTALALYGANTICVGVATVANWFINDRFSFRAPDPGQTVADPGETVAGPAALPAAPPIRRAADRATPDAVPARLGSTAQHRLSWVLSGQRHRASGAPLELYPLPEYPLASVVIPVRNSGDTIRGCVASILAQTYPNLEVIVVGDPDDTSWEALADLAADPRLQRIGVSLDRDGATRDANAKRAEGLRLARGDVLVLTDSDMKMRADWLADGIDTLRVGHHAVASSMIAEGVGYFGTYIDRNQIASRTPRYAHEYGLSADNYGRRTRKPPVTANLFLHRAVYEAVGGPDPRFTQSYEDFEWARRIVDAGATIWSTPKLAGFHAHRVTPRQLVRDYRRSGRGAGMYVRKYPHCRLTQRRRLHALLVPGTLALIVAGTAASLALGQGRMCTTAIVTATVGICVLSAARARSVTALSYPAVTLVLGLCFWSGLAAQLAGLRSTNPNPRVLEVRSVPRSQPAQQPAELPDQPPDRSSTARAAQARAAA
jgi:glycosyltransferase involved in cell wall biosynthesis/putative flippase GtrA